MTGVLRRARALVLPLCLGVSLACGATQKPAAEGAGLIRFDSNVADAEVWVDGRFFAGALGRGIKLQPGTHRLEIRHDDYHTQFVELEVAPGESRTLEIRLAEILP